MFSRCILIVVSCLMAVGTGLGQNRDGDSQTLHEILAELRSMHEDMRVTETTQLLVAELEMQQGVVNRATETVDNARTRLNGIHVDQKRLAAETDHAEEQIDKAANADEKNALAQENERRKGDLETMKSIEREANTTLQEMEQRLQNAQDKLASIESELNATISRLGPVAKDSAQK
jgi:chromosome segregation ATPase